MPERDPFGLQTGVPPLLERVGAGTRKVRLAAAGRHLANEYLAATTRAGFAGDAPDWWARSGQPLIYAESISTPSRGDDGHPPATRTDRSGQGPRSGDAFLEYTLDVYGSQRR